jgi:ribonuclease HI
MNTEIYTDGASRGNPGPGGWAAIIIEANHVAEIAGRMDGATNNQMELTAVIEGLSFAKKQKIPGNIQLHADSMYVLNGLSSWLDGWVKKGWMTMAKKPVENRGLWEQLLELRDYFRKNLELVKVVGHSGHEYNDRCDELAVAVALNKSPELFSGTLTQYKAYLAANPPKSMKKPEKKSSKEAYSYVSLVDGNVHVDKTWAACEKRVKGKPAKYQKVFSKDEETDLIQTYTLQSLL